jgi:hypothetical protein
VGASFKDRVRNGEILSPTQRGFKLKAWERSWEQYKFDSLGEESLFVAGQVIDNLLSEVRGALGILYSEHAPKVSNKRYLELLFAISNRDVSILGDISKSHGRGGMNLFSMVTSQNKAGNEITLDEIAHGSVDGLEKAIASCVERNAKNKNIALGRDPLDLLEFVERESQLSQIYGMYESYWHAILWGGFEFVEIDKLNKVYEVRQLECASEIAHEVSQIRKMRLSVQTGMICANSRFVKLYCGDNYIKPIGSGKSKGFKIDRLENADQRVQSCNSRMKTAFIFLEDDFPLKFLKEESILGFSIQEVLEVLRLLALLGMQYESRFPQDTSAYKVAKLLEFCVKVNRQDLVLAISKSTAFKFGKSSAIIDFLTFKTAKDDLWCHPIVETQTNELSLLIGAITHPVITRVVEHWLVKLNTDLQEKGGQYESTLLEQINGYVEKNTLVTDYDSAVSKRIKFREVNAEEEIDFMLRIGKVVLVGEAKSIVTTDSPISYYRTLGILQHAARQAKRKSIFFEKNIQKIFDELNWTYDSNERYEIVPLIINSNKIHSGFPVLGVPVVDEKIISRFFESGEFPMFTTASEAEGNRHLAWFHLYESFAELQLNLKKYIMSPPQVLDDVKSFSIKTIKIPCVDKDSYKILFSRMTPVNLSLSDRLLKEYPFELKIIDDIDKYTSDLAVVI